MACVQHRLLGYCSLSISEASAPTPIGSQRRCARRCEGLSAWRAYAFPGSRRAHRPPCSPADTCVRTCGHSLPVASCEEPRAERVACRAGRTAAHHGGRAAGWTQARHRTCKSLLHRESRKHAVAECVVAVTTGSGRPPLHGGSSTHGTVPDRGCGAPTRWRVGGLRGRSRKKPCVMWRCWTRWHPAGLPSVPASTSSLIVWASSSPADARPTPASPPGVEAGEQGLAPRRVLPHRDASGHGLRGLPRQRRQASRGRP